MQALENIHATQEAKVRRALLSAGMNTEKVAAAQLRYDWDSVSRRYGWLILLPGATKEAYLGKYYSDILVFIKTLAALR